MIFNIARESTDISILDFISYISCSEVIPISLSVLIYMTKRK